MTVIEALLWGILQGLTEFLPVSSSGHLVLVPWLLGRGPSSMTFDILVHFGTLLAVLIYFRRDLLVLVRGAWHLLRHRRLATPEARLTWLVALSALPAGLVALLLRDFLEQLFGVPPVAAALLLVTGTIMFLAERLAAHQRDTASLSGPEAVVIGVAQSVALAPGISRSGVTISAGLTLGLRRPDAARFSFLMAIPVVLGATALEAFDLLKGVTPPESPLALGVGFVAALVSGYAAIALLLRHLQRHGLRPFAYYCWAMGLFGLAVYLLR
jgi:undecaprenyl-diphosphatase